MKNYLIGEVLDIIVSGIKKIAYRFVFVRQAYVLAIIS